MSHPDSELPQHRDPMLGGTKNDRPFDGELQDLLNNLGNSAPDFESENSEEVNSYFRTVDQFFDELRSTQISNEEVLSFMSFIERRYVDEAVDQKTFMFRDTLIGRTIRNIDLFIDNRGEVIEDRVSDILVNIFSKSDSAIWHLPTYLGGFVEFSSENYEEHLYPAYLGLIYYKALKNRFRPKENE